MLFVTNYLDKIPLKLIQVIGRRRVLLNSVCSLRNKNILLPEDTRFCSSHYLTLNILLRCYPKVRPLFICCNVHSGSRSLRKPKPMKLSTIFSSPRGKIVPHFTWNNKLSSFAMNLWLASLDHVEISEAISSEAAAASRFLRDFCSPQICCIMAAFFGLDPRGTVSVIKRCASIREKEML